MVDYKTAPLDEIKSAIIEDGIIDADEARNIRERIMKDGIVDREEAEFLFAVNDAVSGHDNHPSYEKLFIECITAHVLHDDITPGTLDHDEWNWLKAKIKADGKIDPLEAALLKNIETQALETPEDFKSFLKKLG